MVKVGNEMFEGIVAVVLIEIRWYAAVSAGVPWPGWGDHWRLGQDGGQWEPVSAWCSPDMECTGPHTVTTLTMAVQPSVTSQLFSAFVK